MHRPGRNYDDMVSAMSMSDFGDEEEQPQQHHHHRKLSSLEESPLMPDEYYDEEKEEQYSGQNSEPEWKSARRLTQMSQNSQFTRGSQQMRQSNQFRDSQQMRQSNQFRESQQMRDSNQFRHSNQFRDSQQMRQSNQFRDSQQMRQSNQLRGSNQFRDSQQMRQSNQFRDSQQMRQSNQFRESSRLGDSQQMSQSQLRNSQFSASGGGMNLRDSVGSRNQQRRGFNRIRNLSIRQSQKSNTSSHRSSHLSQSHRSGQFNQREDELSDFASTVDNTTRARRPTPNDLSTLDTATIRSIGNTGPRRPSVNSTEYYLPAAKGIDLCANDDDPLNAIPLDSTSVDQESSKRRRKKKIWCGLILLLLLLGGIATAVLFVTGIISLDGNSGQKSIPVMQNMTNDSTKSSANSNTMTLEEIGRITSQPTISLHPSIAPSIAPSVREVIDVLDIPPDDLEGKCSPSNFPFTIEICKESCAAAECCYLNQDGVVSGCFDTSVGTYNGRLNSHRCTLYRPHCDVFYDPWSGGEDGYIHPAPENLNQLCHKRLRNHQLGRVLDFEDDVCLEACLPSKCCQAMKVAGENDIESIISYLGYVMTSCERQNEEQCRAYNATCFGIFDEPLLPEAAVSSFPSESPSQGSSSSPSESDFESLSPTLISITDSTFNPSTQPVLGTTKPSISPSSSPSLSETIEPTRLPTVQIADFAAINEACTSPTSKNLIVGGNLAAKMECLAACEPGLCCYADILIDAGLTDSAGNPADIESCFDTNREVCEGYSGCLTLTLPKSSIQELPGQPEVPTQDLSLLCSVDSRTTPIGVLNCFEECRKGSCCTASPDESCFNEYQEICGLYGPCQAMLDAYGGDAVGLPPKPPANLDTLCSYDYLLEEKKQNVASECEKACASIGCCLGDECPDMEADFLVPIEDTPAGRCELYSPCQKLSVRDKMQACLGGVSSSSFECQSVCDVADCCFPEPGEDSCFPLFEDLCLLLAPFCAPEPEPEGKVGKKVPPPPQNLVTMCMAGYGGEKTCRDACSPSNCCFAISQSCFAENEDVCSEWEICASREEQEEGFDE